MFTLIHAIVDFGHISNEMTHWAKTHKWECECKWISGIKVTYNVRMDNGEDALLLKLNLQSLFE